MVILERDGVINHRQEEYIITAGGLGSVVGNIEIMKCPKKVAYLVAFASNHSSVARGTTERAS